MKHPRFCVCAALAAALLSSPPLAALDSNSSTLPYQNEETDQIAGNDSEVRVVRDTEKETGTITVDSDQGKTEVYLDAVYQGLTPLVIGPLAPGLYRVYLRKNGYYAESYLVNLTRGREIEISAELRRITGTLEITGAPANAQFFVDGTPYRESVIELSEGAHSVEARAFGFVASRRSVRIERRRRTVIDIPLESAPFDASDFRTSKGAFNPDNPGNLGTLGISFSVTAPGRALVRIYDGGGSLVRTLETGIFSTWAQNIRWDGRDELGQSLPDGEYRLALEATGEGGYGVSGGETLTKEASASIDRGISYPFTGSALGAGSTGRVLSAALMPASGTLVLFDVRGDADSFCPALSAIYGFGGGWEAGVRAGVAVSADSDEAASVDIAAAVKRRLTGGALRTALSARWETGTGLAAGPAAEFRRGILSLGAAADIRVGDSGGGLAGDVRPSASAGAAARASSGAITCGLWALAESGAFGGRFVAGGRLSGGLVFQCLVPRTNLLFLGEADIGHDFADGAGSPDWPDYAIRAGFGILF